MTKQEIISHLQNIAWIGIQPIKCITIVDITCETRMGLIKSQFSFIHLGPHRTGEENFSTFCSCQILNPGSVRGAWCLIKQYPQSLGNVLRW